MKNKLIAQRYADAFISNIEQKDYDSLLIDVDFLKNLFKNNDEAAAILNLFIFPEKDRSVIFDEIGKSLKLNDMWQRLFQLLVKKQKFAIMLSLLDEIEQCVLGQQNTVKVNLRVAHELDNDNRKKLKLFLESKYNKKIILNFIEDKDIIGGFIAETEDELIDGSVKNHLEQFKQFVMNHD